jgi:transcriptional regulator with XRE-family HTH domain
MVNTQTAKLIGKKLRACREEAGLTQHALGKSIGLIGENSQITISNWERGIKRPNIDHIEAYAKLFKKNLDWFFASDEKENGKASHNLVHLSREGSTDILKSMVEQVLMIVNAMNAKPKTEMVKRSLLRVLEDMDVT